MRRIDHTAVAVRDLDEAIPRYERLYLPSSIERSAVPSQGVEVAFLELGDTLIELIQPQEADGGVGRFLAKSGEAMHHIGVQVEDIEAELDRLAKNGVRLIDRTPRAGLHGRIAFVHPHGTGGVLLELVEHRGP